MSNEITIPVQVAKSMVTAAKGAIVGRHEQKWSVQNALVAMGEIAMDSKNSVSDVHNAMLDSVGNVWVTGEGSTFKVTTATAKDARKLRDDELLDVVGSKATIGANLRFLRKVPADLARRLERTAVGPATFSNALSEHLKVDADKVDVGLLTAIVEGVEGGLKFAEVLRDVLKLEAPEAPEPKDSPAVKRDNALNELRDALTTTIVETDDDGEETTIEVTPDPVEAITTALDIVKSAGTVAKSYDDRKRDALRFIVEAMEADDTDTIGAILDIIGETVAADHFMVNA